MDSKGGRKGYLAATVALLTLGAGMAYSLGRQHGADTSAPNWSDSPVEPRTVVMMREAAERARAQGDEDSAEWFENVAQRQMDQMVSWVAAQQHGGRRTH